MRVAIGVDLGGGSLRSAVVREDGEVLRLLTTQTPRTGKDAVLAEIHKQVQSLQREWDVAHIGIGAPGMVSDSGYLHGHAVNISDWGEFDVAAELSALLGSPCVVRNDVAMAAFGESHFGAGRGADPVALIAVGTGIGAGVVVRGQPLSGRYGAAGEIGHLSLDPHGRLCRCGRYGCIEAYCSATGMIERAHELARREAGGLDGPLRRELLQGTYPALEAERIYRGVAEADALAMLVHQESCVALAHAVALLVVSVGAEVVVLGGGVMNASELILPALEQPLRALLPPELYERTRIQPGELGPQAGVIGSAAAAGTWTQGVKRVAEGSLK